MAEGRQGDAGAVQRKHKRDIGGERHDICGQGPDRSCALMFVLLYVKKLVIKTSTLNFVTYKAIFVNYKSFVYPLPVKFKVINICNRISKLSLGKRSKQLYGVTREVSLDIT